MPATPTSKSLLTGLNIIYFSLVFIMTTFGLIVLYLNYTRGIETEVDAEFSQMLRYILIALLPASLGAGYFIFKQITTSIQSSLSLNEKLFKYQTAVLIRSACFEFVGMLGCVFAMISADSSFLLFTGIIIAMFFLFRPTVYSITTDLNLSQSDRLILEKPQAPLI
jgi:cytochrome bd-type quinol oxidase subunit 2